MIRQCCESLSSPALFTVLFVRHTPAPLLTKVRERERETHAHTVIREQLSMAIALTSFAVLHLNDFLVYAYVCSTALRLSLVFSRCSHALCLSHFRRLTLSAFVWKGAMHIYCVVITFSAHAPTSMKWMCLRARVKMNERSRNV